MFARRGVLGLVVGASFCLLGRGRFNTGDCKSSTIGLPLLLVRSKESNGFSCTPSNCTGVGDKNLDMSAVTSSVGLSHRIQL